jgi:hypothetical protein
MNKIILAILCALCFQITNAQVSKDTTAGGAAVIVKDTRVAVLEKKHREKHIEADRKYNNKAVVGKTVVTRTSSSGIVLAPGYRLVIISTPDQAEAMRVRGLLRKYFPDDKIYQTFQMPNTKLRLGNYLDRKQADNVRKRVLAMKIVTNNIFIVSDQVEMRVRKTEENLVADDSGTVTKEKTNKSKKTTKTAKSSVKTAK